MMGLNQNDAQERLEKFGENKVIVRQANSVFSLLIGQYANIVSLILFVAGTFSFYVGEVADCIFIFVVLLVNGLFGFFQEYKSEKTLEKLESFVSEKSRVIREGKELEIESKYLVPGDIVVLEEGKKIPADGVYLDQAGLSVDESIISGESLPVEKIRGDQLFSGTLIFSGKGFFRIEKTGFDTKLGEIVKGISKIKKQKTPLAANLDDLNKKMVYAAFILSLILILIGSYQGREIRELILTAISIAVAVIPEGLPLIVSIALATGAYKMAKEKAIVRKMSSIEALGAANLILTDKTGTITQNKMKVKKYFLSPKEKPATLFLACSLGNTATLVNQEGKNNFDILGDKTDAALALFVESNKVDYEDLKKSGEILFEKPFEANAKTIEVVWKSGEDELIFIKGAPEKIIEVLKPAERERAEDKFNLFSKEGLRTIAFAYKKIDHGVPFSSLKTMGNFDFLGMVGIYDPPRVEARETIEKAKRAGIRVVMVTGDNSQTAKYMAEEVGLIEKDELILTSQEVEKMTDEVLLAVLPRVRIFSRFTPADKLRIVKLFKQKNYVVSVIGDGVNDALALKEANIGIALGASGTDVAREAADIVITDDNLLTTIKAIEEGRLIFNNILKSVFYLISANIAEFAVIFFSIIFYFPAPLLPAQILWINLVTDGIPSLTLGMDTSRKTLGLIKPRDAKKSFLNGKGVLYILRLAVFIIFFCFLIFLFSLKFLTVSEARFWLFNTFVFVELIVIFIVRGGILPLNKFLIISVLFSVLLQIAIIYLPLLRTLFF